MANRTPADIAAKLDPLAVDSGLTDTDITEVLDPAGGIYPGLQIPRGSLVLS